MSGRLLRFAALSFGLPAVCVLSTVWLAAAAVFAALPRLPGWAQGSVLAWVAGGDSGGPLPPVSVPPAGYSGTPSFKCLLPPQYGYLTDVYGTLREGGWVHRGIDYGTFGQPMPVRTPFGGQVVFAGWKGSYGNLVVIENAGYQVYLAHNEALIVTPGQLVSAGEVVGLSGSTGNSTGYHVHFEVRIWDGAVWVAVDPNAALLPGQTVPCSWYDLAASLPDA